MSLYINSPANYARFHGIDEDIYKMCRTISKGIDIKKYTSELDSIGITPIIAPKEQLLNGKWQELKQVSLKYRFADISMQIDYERYISSDLSQRKLLIIDNIMSSLMVVKRKIKDSFNYEQLKRDIKNLIIDSTDNK